MPCCEGVNGPPPGISVPDPFGGTGAPEGCAEFAFETLKFIRGIDRHIFQPYITLNYQFGNLAFHDFLLTTEIVNQTLVDLCLAAFEL